MDFVIHFLNTFFELLSVAIIARILLSWFQQGTRHGRFYRFIYDVTEPIMRIARKVTPKTGMLDFSPLIALVALDIIRALLIKLLLQM